MRQILYFLMITLTVGVSPAFGDRWDFARFRENDSNLPGSYKILRHNIEGIVAKRIHAFSIYGGDCLTGTYSDGSGQGDCSYGSVRSMLRELASGGRGNFSQPDQAWYAWDMLIPTDFPTYTQQTGGGYIFAQWKGFDCPHASIAHNSRAGSGNQLILRLQKTTGQHDCAAVAEINLMPMRDFKGRWRHIEVFANWSNGADGQLTVFIDGKQRGAYRGPTLDPNIRAQNGRDNTTNHFDYGVYLCCTRGVHLVQPGTLYFANVRRARSRENLAR
ncbi:polysaccharide lyase [Defluviimonas sp. WL0075]|uniref:Polysaccharide lyase n=1 Tax=Albidovulum sediminicola TaxID=2984331 RepID=A0ABT2Z0C0_9RHOB|nr:polysaccharide lyase [Defluviimonas sp. WL0075]MCV2864589.1 polysaccharide lyase [Defluviimonas sp. WL0075]